MKKIKNPLLWFSLAASAGILLICSRNSPLYPMNEWVDVHCFFTVGRSMLDGMVPYRDLYEQKGPLLYFVYMLAAMISRDSFIGIYLFETLAFSVYLYYCGKCAQVFRGSFLTGALSALFCGFVTANSRAFFWGGSAEEYCLGLIAYALYAALETTHLGKRISPARLAAFGACAGIVLFVKFTFVGFFVGLCLFAVAWYGALEEWKALPGMAGCFLLGIFAVAAVVLVPFALCGALDDLIEVYFINNLTIYPNGTDHRLLMMIKCLYGTISQNVPLWAGTAIGAGYFLKIRKRHALLMAAALLPLFVGTYWGGKSYPYYGLIFAPFSVFFCAAAAELAERALRNRRQADLSDWKRRSLAVGAAAVAIVASVFVSPNAWRMHTPREELPQYRFAGQIEGGSTLLNYGFLDGGFYFASGAVPTGRFFCRLNIPLQEMDDEMDRQVREGEPDYVVTRNRTLDDYGISGDYECVDVAVTNDGEGEWTYYLYRRAT